jgi:Zn-dependent oligopeptidase
LEDYGKNRNPFAHLEVAQQLTYAMLDQVYYASGSPHGLGAHLPDSPHVDKSKILTLLQPNSTANFEHLVHYGGSYYCYLLCRAMAAHVWDKSLRHDPWNPVSGERLVNFLTNGSVHQTLDAINGILPSKPSNIEVSREALLKDLNRCSSIHS